MSGDKNTLSCIPNSGFYFYTNLLEKDGFIFLCVLGQCAAKKITYQRIDNYTFFLNLRFVAKIDPNFDEKFKYLMKKIDNIKRIGLIDNKSLVFIF